MGKFNIRQTSIEGVLIVEPAVFGDARGFFMETYHRAEFQAAGLPHEFVQDNHSRSRRGTLRGLHFQWKQPQGKLVRVVRGEVFDVAVDLRPGSPTFGSWVGVALSDDNKRQLYVPPGLAHGFCSLEDDTELVYKCTDYYAPQYERTLQWNDPEVGVAWPISEPLLSLKDASGESLAALFTARGREPVCSPPS